MSFLAFSFCLHYAACSNQRNYSFIHPSNLAIHPSTYPPIYPFTLTPIHPSIQYLLRTYHVQGTIPGTRVRVENKINKVSVLV